MIRSYIPYTEKDIGDFITAIIEYLKNDCNYNVLEEHKLIICDILHRMIQTFCDKGIDSYCSNIDKELNLLLSMDDTNVLRYISNPRSNHSDPTIAVQFKYLPSPIYLDGCRGWCHASYYKNGYNIKDLSTIIKFSR